jgi:hypothetical protein
MIKQKSLGIVETKYFTFGESPNKLIFPRKSGHFEELVVA